MAYGPSDSLEWGGIHWEPLRCSTDLSDLSGGRPVIVDSYRLSSETLAALAQAVPVIAMHDSGAPPPGVRLVVSPGARETSSPLWLSGLNYACLRPAFWGLPPREIHDKIERVVVAVGGWDPDGLGVTLAQAVSPRLPGARIALIGGSSASPYHGPDDLELVGPDDSPLEQLLTADVMITGAGQTMLEALATGAPCIAVVIAENQRPQARRVADARAACLTSRSADAVTSALLELAGSPHRRRLLSARAQQLVDGYGALRVAFRVARLVRGIHQAE
jgi:hypothetical protein